MDADRPKKLGGRVIADPVERVQPNWRPNNLISQNAFTPKTGGICLERCVEHNFGVEIYYKGRILWLNR